MHTVVEQTLTEAKFAVITNFTNLAVEFDDTVGSVSRFALSDPTHLVEYPIKVRYRYGKTVA